MPETIGLALFALIGVEATTISILGVSVSTAVIAGEAVIIGGTIGLNALVNHTPGVSTAGAPALPPPDNGNQPLRQTIPPRNHGYGHGVRLSGSYVLFEVDSSGNSWDIIAFHHGLISAIRGYYLHDDVVAIDPVTGVVDDQGDGRYSGGIITIKTRLGLPTETSYSDVVSALPDIWTTAHRGDDLASLMMKCAGVSIDVFTTEYPRQLPLPSVVADLAPIFDARDPAQSHDDPSTWVVSSNPVLQAIDYLTNTDTGMGLDYDVLIAPVLDDLMAEADICDEAVLLADGTSESRYRSGGTYTLDSDHADVLQSIFDTCDGWISENGDGSLALKVGKFRTPTITLGSRHITGFSLKEGVEDEDIVNELDLTYTEPAADYKTVPGQPWRNEQSIADIGKAMSQPLPLPWVHSHPQARRLAKRRDAKLNAPLRGTIETKLYGLRALGERWIKIEATENAPDDLADLMIENGGISIDLMNARLTINFVAVDPDTIDAWDPETEEGSPPEIPAKLVTPPPPDLENVVATEDHDWVIEGRPPSPILLTFDNPHRGDLTYQGRFRVLGDVTWILGPKNTGTVSDDGTRITVNGTDVSQTLTLGVTYEIQVSSFAPAGARSAWSPTIPIQYTIATTGP